MTISTDGTITTELITADEITDLTPDETVSALESAWITDVNDMLGATIGYSEVTFNNYDEDGYRLVRRQSTNSGDFTADALYYLFDDMGLEVDLAVMNAGGIRNGAITGNLTYFTCKEIHTFGNIACMIRVTGQQILDAIEWGTKEITSERTTEDGSMLHVSGLKYTLDLTIESTVQGDDKDVWVGTPTGEYRIKDVYILNRESGEYEPLDLTKEYNMAGYKHTLTDLGGGYDMLKGVEKIADNVAEDYLVLAKYIMSFPVSEETGLPTITD